MSTNLKLLNAIIKLKKEIEKIKQDRPRDGVDGINGLDGRPGIDGIDGKPGKDGVGIKDAYINEQGHLILVLTNDKEIDCGKCQGENTVKTIRSMGRTSNSIKDAKIVNGELIITLENGKTINAGSVVAEPGEITEKDPVFSNSPANTITNENIESWNNKVDKNELEKSNKKKYNKTGGTISGDVNVEGNFNLKIEDEDFDTGIKFDRELNDNYGTILTLTGYANSTEATNYKPIIRNVNTPVNNYDVANKKYVDKHIVIPNYYLIFLKADGTVDLSASSLKYENVKSNLTDPLKEDILDVVWGNTRFYMPCVEIVDVNDGDIKFINDIEFDGIQRHMVLTLKPDSTLITTSITTNEITSNKVQDIINNSTRQDLYPSVWAVFNQFQRKPDVIYSDPTGFEASNDHAGDTWHLTGLDLKPYKRIKCYVCSGGDSNSSYSPEHIVEVHLDDRAKGSFGYFTADHAGHCPNNRNRHHMVTFTVNAEKTAIQFQHSISIYGTSASDSVGGRRCYLIEGYYD